MEAINFIKETHKHYLGDIDINVKDENGFTYYDYAVLFKAIDDDHYVICPDCINSINKTKCLFGEGYYTDKNDSINCTVCNKKLDLDKKFHICSKELIDIYNSSDEEEIFKMILDVLDIGREDFILILLTNILNCKPKEKEKLIEFVNNHPSLPDKKAYKLSFIKFCIGQIDNIDDIYEILSFIHSQVHHYNNKPSITFTKNNINRSAFNVHDIDELRKLLKYETIKTVNRKIDDFIKELPFSCWFDKPHKVRRMMKAFIKYYIKRYANVMKLFDDVDRILDDCVRIFYEIDEKYYISPEKIIDDVRKYIENTMIE